MDVPVLLWWVGGVISSLADGFCKKKFPLVYTTSEQGANGKISALPNIKGGVGRDKVALISTPGTACKKIFATSHCISLCLSFVSFCISNSYDTPE